MIDNIFPLSTLRCQQLAHKFGSPFYLYDEKAIKNNIKNISQAFSIFTDANIYFALDTLPNPYILKILAKLNIGASCSSLPQIIIAERAGLLDEKILFSSTFAQEKELIYANLKGSAFAIYSEEQLYLLENVAGNLSDTILLEYNPTKTPEEQTNNTTYNHYIQQSDLGLDKNQLFKLCKICHEKNVPNIGVQCKVQFNQQDYHKTVQDLFKIIQEIKEKLNITISLINLKEDYKNTTQIKNYQIEDYQQLAQNIKTVNVDPIKLNLTLSNLIITPYTYFINQNMWTQNIINQNNQNPQRYSELLLREDSSVLQVRQAETYDEYFKTIDFIGLRSFK